MGTERMKEMRKLCRFLGTVISLSAIAYTAYSLYEKYGAKKEDDNDEDFDDFFEDASFKEGKGEKREYVTIDIDKDENKE